VAGRCVQCGWLTVSAPLLRLTDPGVLFADVAAPRLWTAGP
jgi:hypothetical protein